MTAPAQDLQPDLLTVDDIRRLTQLGRDTVYRLIREGQLRAIPVGSQFRVPREEYEAWKRRAIKASAAPSIPFTLTAPSGRGQRSTR